MKQHNLTGLWPKERKVTLPSSKVVASIPCRDAKECTLSLLTDPRLKDEDYLFWGDNPFAPPPESVEHIEDLNTGEAHLKSHKEMITKPNQILLMVPMCIDGATTGQFGSWRDWALVDWGKEWGVLPCKIWCFVDLSNADLPTGKSTIQHGDVDLKKGVCAVVENVEIAAMKKMMSLPQISSNPSAWKLKSGWRMEQPDASCAWRTLRLSKVLAF